MIILYGWESDRIKCERIENAKCPHCQSQGSFIGYLNGRYFHIFYLPIFPYKKTTEFKCQNCGDTYEGKSLARLFPDEYFKFRRNAGFPLFHFAGIFLVAGITIWIIISQKMDSKREIKYLQNPKIGDVYVYETPNEAYSTFKIVGFNSDTLIFLQNEYEIKNSSQVREINKETYYSTEKYLIVKDTLTALYKEGKIKNILRD